MLRIGIKRLTGDPAIVGPAMVLGRAWAKEIHRRLELGDQPALVRQETVGFGVGTANVRVQVSRDLTGDYSAGIWVDAESGCRENSGFLLKTVAGQWYAYYNDGVREHIDPVDGTPRPNPDPAVRTKRVKVPSQLQHMEKRAAMFSGLMRMAVQCDHSRGVNTVFSHTWLKTHGILELLDQAPDNAGSSKAISAQAQRNRYWVIEISPDGIFAAPVSWSGKCCDGFSVEKYLPTKAEVAAYPALAAYREELSLKVSRTLGKSGITQVATAADMASAYVGEPWNLDDGWAFSRTGQHAQNVTARQSGLHYRTERWKIDFTVAFNGVSYDIAASVNRVEEGDLMFPATDPLWVPSSDSEWAAVSKIIPTDLTAMSGPVHVFYQGETEFVTRYNNSGPVSFPATTTGSFNNPSDPWPMNRDFAGTRTYNVCGGPWAPGYAATSTGNSMVEGAYSGNTSGYSNPARTGTGNTSTSGRLIEERTTSFNGNTYTDFDEPAEVFPFACCGASIHTRIDRQWEYMDGRVLKKGISNQSWYSACVLLHREREGILLLDKKFEAGDVLTNELNHDVVRSMRSFARILSGGPYTPDPCWSDVGGDGTEPGWGGPRDLFFSPSSTDTYTIGPYATNEGTFTLVLGAQTFGGTLPLVAGDVRDDINRAFSNPTPARALVLDFDAMHGAMYYAPADPGAKQPDNAPPLVDQRNNAIYRFPTNTVTIGGFPNDDNPFFAFVGQA